MVKKYTIYDSKIPMIFYFVYTCIIAPIVAIGIFQQWITFDKNKIGLIFGIINSVMTIIMCIGLLKQYYWGYIINCVLILFEFAECIYFSITDIYSVVTGLRYDYSKNFEMYIVLAFLLPIIFVYFYKRKYYLIGVPKWHKKQLIWSYFLSAYENALDNIEMYYDSKLNCKDFYMSLVNKKIYKKEIEEWNENYNFDAIAYLKIREYAVEFKTRNELSYLDTSNIPLEIKYTSYKVIMACNFWLYKNGGMDEDEYMENLTYIKEREQKYCKNYSIEDTNFLHGEYETQTYHKVIIPIIAIVLLFLAIIIVLLYFTH